MCISKAFPRAQRGDGHTSRCPNGAHSRFSKDRLPGGGAAADARACVSPTRSHGLPAARRVWRTAEPSSSTAPRDDGPARHRHRLGTMSEPGLLSSCISKEKCVRVPAGWWESTWIHLRTLNRDAHQKSCLRGVTTRCPREEPELTWDLGATVNPEEALAARMRLQLPPGRSGATPQNEALPGA